MVVCPSKETAEWASNVELTELHGVTFKPFVLGPDQLPEAVDEQAINGDVFEILLSFSLHQESPRRREILENILRRLDRQPSDEAVEYAEILAPDVSDEEREVFRELIGVGHRPHHRILLGDSNPETVTAR